MKRMHMRRRKLKKRPFLSQLTEENPQKVPFVFTDEKKFRYNWPDGYNFYWQLAEDKKNNEMFSKDYNMYNDIMVHLAISDAGILSCDRITGKLNSDKWETLECDNVLPSIYVQHNTDFIYQQDNTSLQKGKETCEHIDENGFMFMNQPSQIQDLNPVENIWSLLARRICANGVSYVDDDQLWEAIQHEASGATVEEVQSYTKSYRKRLCICLLKKGGYAQLSIQIQQELYLQFLVRILMIGILCILLLIDSNIMDNLYDRLSESAANPIVNNASSVKFIDLKPWYYKSRYDAWSSFADTPIKCPFIGNFQQYPQMLIISVSNQLQGITLQEIGGFGFSNVCYKQNLIGAPVLWGQNMLFQEQNYGRNFLIERDILIRNRLEILDMNQQYSDRDVYNFSYDNKQFILLTEPVRYNLLSYVIADKRGTFKDDGIEYAGGDQQTAVTVTFLNNHIISPQYCDAFIERVYQHENGRLVKCGFDFETVIQRTEVINDPNQVGRDLVEALYPERIRYKHYKTTALSKYRTPMDVKQDSVSNKQVTYRI
ncbi:MAG: hypothetical protein EZS28_001808 [Streblomastix strix]|uniref:Uncharacterized protein n=1 Tax=Streblomastix strix TaxID=222440 RepID=A0A5J4X706_9EUKA|nr:MAG: hypothetical protein EZS28_001808 [Streblomastix strix]